MGDLVLLQNCHLSKSFMPELELIIEKLADCRILNPKDNEDDRLDIRPGHTTHFIEDGINPEFRLILTSRPASYFPITILQNGVKLTNEPPKGIKANMMKAFNDLPSDMFTKDIDENKVSNLKAMLYNLTLFHSLVLERRKFGPLGYNILYDFNDSDLDTTQRMVKIMLQRYNDLPYGAIKYLTAEINYGGRVTDDWDRRTIATMLELFVREEAMQIGYAPTDSDKYSVPEAQTIEDIISAIKEYPELDPSSAFMMNANAEISYQIKESKKAIETVLSLERIEHSEKKEGEKTPDDIVLEFSLKLQTDNYPKLILKEGQLVPEISNYEDPLDVCLVQEVERFNILISFISNYVVDLEKAVKGELVMTEELEQTYYSILNNQVPASWNKLAYPSMKSLAGWYEDLLLRIDFFRNWYIEGKPSTYWLSAFYFPQGFLTSVLQSYSRSTKIAIDKLNFSFEFKNVDASSISGRPEKGCYIRGLYMEACKFEPTKMALIDNTVGTMSSPAPIIYFIPTENYTPKDTDYPMPLYKTVKRAGSLSATGQSTNFILTVYIPTIPRYRPPYWILNGAALVCDRNE